MVVLDEHEADEVHRNELADRLATEENGTGPDGESAAGYKPVYTEVYQSHPPVLEETRRG
ncbi:DUF7344 domain-containing protein [Natronosalvus caseinilyticus]|uniref:DUF7344 domain-containing protein n=1 Tax=Natronosalvus caseinilyticus TaxID=2953747 RepID=UPI003CCD4AE0